MTYIEYYELEAIGELEQEGTGKSQEIIIIKGKEV